MGLANYLWLGVGPAPLEYLELILCRDIYHCTPDELDKQSLSRVWSHLVAQSEENKIQQLKVQLHTKR